MKTQNSAVMDKIDPELDRNLSINQWVQQYAEMAGPVTLNPTIETVKAAIKEEFPELIDTNLDREQLLDALGIHAIADCREFVVAWYGTTDETAIESLLHKFQTRPYSNVRKKLGIDHLWVMKLNPNLGHSRNDVFEAYFQFSELDEKPECAIIDL